MASKKYKMYKARPNWFTSNGAKLIREYRRNPVLWHSKHLENTNREARRETYQRISDTFGTEIDAIFIRGKINALRNQFFKEQELVEKGEKSHWEFYESLKFLQNQKKKVSILEVWFQFYRTHRVYSTFLNIYFYADISLEKGVPDRKTKSVGRVL